MAAATPKSVVPTASVEPTKELSFLKNVAYSAIGGVCGATAVYPLDFVKTQLQGGKSSNPVEIVKMTMREGGVAGFYRGLPANLIGIMPEKTIKLCANDFFRQSFGVDEPGGSNIMLEGLAGGLAGALQITVTTPMEICKIQMQLQPPAPGTSQLTALSELVGRLGFTGMYQGAFATFMRDCPFSVMYFGLYGVMRRKWADPETNKVSSTAALMSATVAGSVGSGLTTPLDVIKTRMQSAGADPADGFASTARKIVQSEGGGALWKARRSRGGRGRGAWRG